MEPNQINSLMAQAMAMFTAHPEIVLDYVDKNTNLKQLKEYDFDETTTITMAAFVAGMKFALEFIDFKEVPDNHE